MNTLDALLSGIVAEPLEETRWLVLADWLEENDDPRRTELLRPHHRLRATGAANLPAAGFGCYLKGDRLHDADDGAK